MNTVFADTFYYLALLSEDDAAHEWVADLSREMAVHTVTTTWVLTEVGDALADPKQRGLFTTLVERLKADPHVTIVPATQDLFDRAVDLHSRRPDKGWSLTDCASFVVMEEHELSDALTGDHHFEQAGFTPLLA